MSILSTLHAVWISPQAYCRHVEHYLSIDYDPCPPSTVAELNAALERWPDYARRWLPSEAECIRFGIDRTLDFPVVPLTGQEQESLLATLRDDAEFRLACRALLTGGAA
jgi:hypothetical protein